jgi:hypothetical protein
MIAVFLGIYSVLLSIKTGRWIMSRNKITEHFIIFQKFETFQLIRAEFTAVGS